MNKKFLKKLNSKFFVFVFILVFSFVVSMIPCYASSETMTFNLWDTYQNAMHIGFDYYDSYGSHSWQFCGTRDNTVNLSADNITTIQNNVFIKPDYDKYNFINNFQISVPTDKLKPAFYVGKNYLNKEIYFTVQVSVKMYNGIFNEGSALYPTASIYMGENAEHYNPIYCNIATFQYNFTDDTLFCKFDCKITFKSTGFICGFIFNVGNDSGDPKGFGIHLKNNSAQPFFRATYTLSPLFFSNDITEEDIQNSVESALNGVIGGDNFESPDNGSMNAYFDQENAIFNGLDELKTKFTIPDILNVLNNNVNLKYALIYFSNIIEDWRLNVPFVNTLLIFSMALGSIGFVFGLVQTIIRVRGKK